MASSKSHSLLMAATLAGLVAWNLALTVGLLCWMQARPTPSWNLFWNLLNQFGLGLFLGQAILIGYWFGLAEGRWYIRLTAAIALTLSLALSLHWAWLLASMAGSRDVDDPWAIIGFVLIAMMLAASVLGFVLRRTRGWRLTWRWDVELAVIHQFQIADSLIGHARLVRSGRNAICDFDRGAHAQSDA